MAREKVEQADQETTDEGEGQGARARPSTAATAARTRTVMQRRHLRLGLLSAAAIGAEVAGAAGLAAGALLPWLWGEPLLGRTDPAGVIGQVAIVLMLLALVAAWLPRQAAPDHPLRVRTRLASLVFAATVLIIAGGQFWQADPGSRGAGPVVAGLGALLVAAGAVGWLVTLRQLKVLFPFGLADARSRGFGNLPAVRRAQLLGGPAGAVGGVALVAGALLVTPGWVGTVESQTASALTLTGDTPSAAGDPAWTLELAAADAGRGTQLWPTPHGLVVEEESGARGVDPRTGATRWHWRDEAYQRVGGTLAHGGQTVVLALEYQGAAERDKVVALDAATGELRWERFDTDLVGSIATIAVAGEGDWFVVPDRPPSPAVTEDSSLSLRAYGSDDGEVRWELAEEEDCSFTAATADAPGVLLTTQQCAPPAGEQDAPDAPPGAGCVVTGVDPATGETSWVWPTDGAPAGEDGAEAGEDAAAPETPADCQVAAPEGMVLVSYSRDGQQAATALDPETGAPVWAAEEDDDLAGLRGPVRVGDALTGAESSGPDGGELVIRDADTGTVRETVPLPEGEVIEYAASAPGTVAITQFRQSTAELALVEVDIGAAEVSSETVLGAAPEGSQFQRVTVISGPEALAVGTLIATGADPETASYTLTVEGW